MRVRWANFPVPEAYLVGIALGWILDYFFRLKLFEFDQVGISLGVTAVLIGLGLCLWSVAVSYTHLTLPTNREV